MADCDTGELSKVVVIQIFFKIFSGTRKGSTPREQGKGGWERREVAFSESGGGK